jgi:hypothetical protein
MAKYQLVHLSGAPTTSAWTIEEVTPGEKPIPISFYGTKAQAAQEASRLFLFEGRDEVSKGFAAAFNSLPTVA